MPRLTSEGEQLVQAARAALRPSDADRERILQALQPRLDGVGLDAMNAGPRTSALTKTTLVKISAVVIGLGLAGGAFFLSTRPESPPAKTTASAPVAPPPVARAPSEAPIEAVPESTAVVLPEAPPDEKPAAPPLRRSDRLAQEVAILSRAGAELHAGRAAAALKILDEHSRKFPNGVLGQERIAARVQALCALGRMKQAQAELAGLARKSPRSPHVARARKACGFDNE